MKLSELAKQITDYIAGNGDVEVKVERYRRIYTLGSYYTEPHLEIIDNPFVKNGKELML